MLVPVPLIEEQDDIARSLAILDKKYANAELMRANLHDLFRTILHELMTARIRVNNLDMNN